MGDVFSGIGPGSVIINNSVISSSRPLNRRVAQLGRNVRVTFTDGSVLTGRLCSWGTQVLVLALDVESKAKVGHDWARDSFSTLSVARVEYL